MESWLIVKPDHHHRATEGSLRKHRCQHNRRRRPPPWSCSRDKTFCGKVLRGKDSTVDFRSDNFGEVFSNAAKCILRCIHPLPDWTYLWRTMPSVTPLLQPVEDVIRTELIQAMLGCGAPGDPKLAMLTLPARLGGLGLTNPVYLTDCYDHSVKLTAPLAEQIKEQSLFLGDIPAEQQLIKQQIHRERRAAQVTEANQLKASFTQGL